MHLIQGLIAFFGRFLLSLIFISSGVHQILDWQGTQQILTNTLNDWAALTIGMGVLQNVITYAQSSVPLLLAAAIFCQVIGGLCILLGIQVRFGAFLLIVFLAPVTILFHHFWLLQGPDRQMQMVEFMKNISILGGLLILLAYGKCKKSRSNEASHSSDS
ncbi:MAG: DoxX family protein [Verrucomicrobia bacterium]|nr:DoxX family protein [Verrucomicrobiota bacterium]